MERRNFLKKTGLLSAAGFLSSPFPLTAGPFKKEEFLHSQFPSDKKLDPAWLKSIQERGEVTTYKKSKNELRYIGMPVGGICSGCVYVGGDGRLWLWDIFNQNQLGVVTKTLPVKLSSFNITEINNIHGSLYLEPLTEASPLQQGFALSITHSGGTIIRRLIQDDWEEVIFEATYPVATIKYIDSHLPVEVSLKAFTPFIPGNAQDSGLPATIQSISFKNVSDNPVSVEVYGWLENKMLLNSEKKNASFIRENSIIRNDDYNGVAIQCRATDRDLEKAGDFGNMCFASFEKNAICIDNVYTSKDISAYKVKDLVQGSEHSPIAGIITNRDVGPGRTVSMEFIISWYMPNLSFYSNGNPQGMTVQGAETHYYTTHYDSAAAVARYIAQNYPSLRTLTFLWKQNWYDSSLPWWFLERTFANISTLATTATHRFQSGRYYAWEGVGCCHGNCTHVYQYAQAVSRIFPELERDTRERVDLGIGYDETSGMIRIRGEKTGPSIDGQAGTVLRIYREHQMNKDYSYLKNNWPKIKQAVIFIMAQDKNGDGMEDTPMENTLDALWHGEIAWIVGLCIAGVRAGQVMAEEMDDTDFAARCRAYVEKGSANMEKYLFNGEYFIHRTDPAIGKKEIGSFNTCHIDQVYGQSWAMQVNLDRILSKEKTMSALKALWKYNYMPDVGAYIKVHNGGRFYAVAGEGGMVMNTNPKNEENPFGNAKAWQVGYFDECMSGFEHQVASHMMAEGMTEESMVLTRSVHDRYHAYKRNPFNEVECSDHYGRAMASYGTFISACGFTYHGPKGHMGFAPKLNPENFKAPFTAAGGWGSYSQKRTADTLSAELIVLHGKLNLKQFTVELADHQKATKAVVLFNGHSVPCSFKQTGNKCEITMTVNQWIHTDQNLSLNVS